VAEELSARAHIVHVYAPPIGGSDAASSSNDAASAVRVHRLADRFGPRSLLDLLVRLRRLPKPRRIIVQYVPQSFGMRALNFPFALAMLTLRGLPLWVMFHEFAIVDDARESLGRRLQAFGTRRMAALMALAAQRAFVSTPAWSPLIKRAAGRHAEITWLPVPSNVPTTNLPETAVGHLRALLAIADDTRVVGHFGTYSMIETCRLLQAIVPAVLGSDPARRFFLMGRNGQELANGLILRHPELASRLVVTGELTPEKLAAHLRACDVLVQPYADGVTARRGSLIAGLALGIPIVSNTGERTEDFWKSSDALVLAAGDARSVVDAVESLLGDSDLRARLAFNARALYRARFDVRHTVDALREAVASGDPLVRA
jgi:glycosyltransferase involved in cell wall biosynthesis